MNNKYVKCKNCNKQVKLKLDTTDNVHKGFCPHCFCEIKFVKKHKCDGCKNCTCGKGGSNV